jgi:phosphoenolpyruvate synthase/pyruvate phosphate dikinase
MYIKKSFDLKKLENKEWYHQRFDGCPMFLWFIADAEVRKEKRKPSGTEADVRVCFFDSGKADWYLDMKDVNRGAKVMIQKAKHNPKISKKMLADWRQDEEKFEDFFYKIFSKLNLQKMADDKLAALWNKFWNLCLKRQTSSSIIDHFALGTDVLIRDMLRKELKDKVTRETDFTKLFSIATAPVRQSFINKAEIDLLKIITGKSKEKLSDYQKRYYWIKNNYFLAQEISIDDFEKEIDAWHKSGKNLQEELTRIENTPKISKSDKDKFFKTNKVSPLLKTLLIISEDFTWWQDERKKSTLFTIDIGMKILKEISCRKGYIVDDLRYALAGEISFLIEDGKPTKLELQKRAKECVVVATREGNYIATGEKVSRIKKIICGEKDFSAIRDFRGLTASVGIARGRVKIVRSSTEIDKVEKGDILVAVMTRPDYVVAMKKAAAIVTNEGGITSHAAIISRELGIPCVIGTKIATEVLHDGDFVEVNANHGIVKILE